MNDTVSYNYFSNVILDGKHIGVIRLKFQEKSNALKFAANIVGQPGYTDVKIDDKPVDVSTGTN